MKNSTTLIAVCLTLCQASLAREWKSAKGVSLEAELVNIMEPNVVLLVDKKTVPYPISGLSQADQDYIRVQANGKSFEPGVLPYVKLDHHFSANPRKLFSSGGAAEIYRNTKGRAPDELSSIDVLPNETFYARLPTGYDGQKPCSLLVYVGPMQAPNCPAGWKTAADELNMVIVSPQSAGVETPLLRRLRLTLDTLATAKVRFNIEPTKCILGGLQGGGSVTKAAAAMSEGQVIGWAGWDNGSPPADIFSPSILKGLKWAPMIVKHQFYDRDREAAAKWPATKLNFQLFDATTSESMSAKTFTSIMQFLGISSE